MTNLSICKYRTVEARQTVLHKWNPNQFKYFLLRKQNTRDNSENIETQYEITKMKNET